MNKSNHWERATFIIINQPVLLITAILNLPLSLVYFLCRLLILPMVIILFCFNIMWLIVLPIVSILSAISKAVPLLRPFSFVIALPFLVFGSAIVTLAPILTPEDTESKIMKWNFLENFPYGNLYNN